MFLIIIKVIIREFMIQNKQWHLVCVSNCFLLDVKCCLTPQSHSHFWEMMKNIWRTATWKKME